QPLIAPDVFIEQNTALASTKLTTFAKPTIVRLGDGTSELRLTISEGGAPADLMAGSIRVTVVDGERSLEQDLVVATATAQRYVGDMASRFWTAKLWAMLGLATLGGFTLNFMPCVLPVLSLKLFGLMACAERPRFEIRLGLLVAAAGIIVSFLALAGALIGFKSAGLAIGWG